jgi:hypothetical protein
MFVFATIYFISAIIIIWHFYVMFKLKDVELLKIMADCEKDGLNFDYVLLVVAIIPIFNVVIATTIIVNNVIALFIYWFTND